MRHAAAKTQSRIPGKTDCLGCQEWLRHTRSEAIKSPLQFLRNIFGNRENDADQIGARDFLDSAKTNSSNAHHSYGVKRSTYEALPLAIDLSDTLYELAKDLIKEQKNSGLSSLKFTEPREVSEPNEFLSSISPAISDMQTRVFYRWKATGPLKTMSVRATQSLVEIFIVPNQLAMFLSISEFGARLQSKMILRREATNYLWLHDENPLDADSARKVMLRCLNDTVDENIEAKADYVNAPAANLQDKHNQQVDGLLLANQNLLFKLVNQQEATKNEIARELHDSVLADLMMLKRYLAGDRELSKQEMADIVDDITKQLRDICNECTPKTLNEWGLKVSLESLLQKLHERQGTTCTFDCEHDISNLPEIVELNVYRIFQECINNIAKYAFATKVDFHCGMNRHKIVFVLTDNGKGFSDLESAEPSAQGYGLRSMQERAELIRCFFPTRLNIESKTGAGTTVILEIEIGHDF